MNSRALVAASRAVLASRTSCVTPGKTIKKYLLFRNYESETCTGNMAAFIVSPLK